MKDTRPSRPAASKEPRPTKGAPKQEDFPGEKPRKDWSVEKLTEYILDGLEQARQERESLVQLGGGAAVRTFRVGRALTYVRDGLKPKKQWKAWQEEHKLAAGTVSEAIRLFERAKSEDKIKGLSITDAKVRYRVIAKPSDPKAPASILKRLKRHGKGLAEALTEAAAVADWGDLDISEVCDMMLMVEKAIEATHPDLLIAVRSTARIVTDRPVSRAPVAGQ
ncbi:hypothetical protein [Tautonia plasticadhaerens]|uniref:Uncharacterized protein n=1 Tax=Tautonia plasticadhaerens TaxID=2527974 RepID=A0A518HA07_9BACT|nr:hypothetical protein [Tautonia plasticadhaerens]QDV37576.1 hypothetical protein ElP_55160 [Tautonia plasticadhaerens]